MNTKVKHLALWIAGICIVLFILQNLVKGLTENFLLMSSLVLQRPWTLITSMFIHSSFLHLLFNMFGLIIFGTILENSIGSKKFLLLYVVSGLIAGIISIFFYPAVLGASGAIFGIIGTLAITHSKMTIWVYGMPMPMYAAAIVWAGVDVIGIVFPHGVANLAHLTGLGVGIIYGLITKRKPKEKTEETPMFVNEKEMKEWEDKYMK